MNWTFLKSKVFWTAAVTVLLEIANYAISNNLFPEYTAFIGIIIVALGGISTAIGGTVNSVRVTALKTKLLKSGRY